MDGRFPFDNGGRAPPQLSAAQLRAVLNLSNRQQGLSGAEYYLQAAAQEQQQLQLQQQQQRQHQLLLQQRQQQQQQQLLQQQQQQIRQQDIQRDIQRDIQLRQLLLQEQLSQQRQELQLRAIGDQLQDYPDLQQHYQNLLIDERIQRQRQNINGASVNGLVGSSNEITSSVQRQQQAALLRGREERLRAYKEQLLLQQQQPLATSALQDEVIQANAGRTLPSALLLPGHVGARLPPSALQLDAIQRQTSNASILQRDLGVTDLSGSGRSQNGVSASHGLPTAVAGYQVFNVDDQSSDSTIEERTTPRRSIKRSNSDQGTEEYRSASKKLKKKGSKKLVGRQATLDDDDDDDDDTWNDESPSASDSNEYQTENIMDTLAYAADLVDEEPEETKGTIMDLLDAAEEAEHMESAAMILVDEIAEATNWSESDDEKDKKDDEVVEDDVLFSGIKVVTAPAENISLQRFTSSIPSLPEEPELEDEVAIKEPDQDNGIKNEVNEIVETESAPPKQPVKSKKAVINEYPYPVDTWWPSVGGMRRERKSCGESTDEDAFEDEPTPSTRKEIFRANSQKITKRLSQLVQPGVLEKLPHCKIHRIKSKRKKNSNAIELAYCWQVTELYPNDPMVNCSVCGTWRHICCGGHYKPYSVREHTKTPFVAVCENCHEEEQYMNEFPRGAKRIVRQRAEQLRRGLATSAVMRYASYSKHGGTYKWPLGSVSSTHILGHTRSVQARHDKGEKQWNDMASRLYRGHGYRSKERVRSRTKELERLLVAVEDAEGYTDRHNMFVFLQRDTAKPKPAGLESEMRNIFDPADDEEHDEHQLDLWNSLESPTNGIPGKWIDDDEQTKLHSNKCTTSPASVPINGCVRVGCKRARRFDSRFCSDACGVSTMEVSLLHALQDASDLHPSVLRHS